MFVQPAYFYNYVCVTNCFYDYDYMISSTVNINHVIKTYIHTTGVKTACEIAETVQLRGALPQTPIIRDMSLSAGH